MHSGIVASIVIALLWVVSGPVGQY